MSDDDWAPGDLALCVNNKAERYPGRKFKATGGPQFIIGVVYTVYGIGYSPIQKVPVLFFENPSRMGATYRFRKLRPFTDVERRAELRDLPVPHPENIDA